MDKNIIIGIGIGIFLLASVFSLANYEVYNFKVLEKECKNESFNLQGFQGEGFEVYGFDGELITSSNYTGEVCDFENSSSMLWEGENFSEKDLDKNFVVENCEPDTITRGAFGYKNLTGDSEEILKDEDYDKAIFRCGEDYKIEVRKKPLLEIKQE